MVRVGQLLAATALAVVLTSQFATDSANAQDVDLTAVSQSNGNSPMLLEADTLVYDHDQETVTAVGGVQIDYNGNRLVAQRVSYNRQTKRLVASGNVEVVQPDGTRVFTDRIDVTDDFRDGFVNTLRLETVDKTYFAAESGQREGGTVTTFNNGVYTACEPCEAKPDKAPIWRIKARKIIWDGKARTVRFERSRFELFGQPIAFIPAFEIADPTIQRKSGFLIPQITQDDDLGVGVTVPYFWALSDTYDLTLQGTYYSKQGFLGEAEWRQRFNNGEFSLKMAGISQRDPSQFSFGTENAGTLGNPNELRGMIGSKGRFDINPRWAFGWDVMAQSDKNFSHTYNIDGYSELKRKNEVYLTGLNDRNYFDIRGQHFKIQEDYPDGHPEARSEKQALALPTIDYSMTPDRAIFGGELNIDVNMQSLVRDRLDSAFNHVRGPEGSSQRLTAEAEWKRSIVTDGGLVITPLLHVRGDTIHQSVEGGTLTAYQGLAAEQGVDADVRNSFNRLMATAGLEMRYPVLFSGATSSHVFEPMAQVFVRPDADYQTTLGIPNEDAQSFVFDASTLFERDKFSGYDRVEGGSRANIGVRYSGVFSNGWSTNAVVGQSYALSDNAFGTPDPVYAGYDSGLETDTSDYVAMAGFSSPHGFSGSISTRLDEQTFEMRRTEVKAGATIGSLAVTGRYAWIQGQKNYGFQEDRQEAGGTASLRLNENWRVFGSATYDIQENLLARDSFGFSYDDECFTFALSVSETRRTRDRETERTIGFNIAFRTIGDFGQTTNGSTFN
ncbi:LPS-assembly protein LptD [Limoniibacter endophyticus]